MDVNQEIARLVNELVDLARKEKLDAGYDNLTIANVRLMGHLFFAESPLTMREVASTIDVSLPSASVTVDRLEGIGLLVRQHDKQDRRVVHVVLTNKSRKLIGEHIKKSTQPLKDALNEFSDTEKEIVLRFFRAHVNAAYKQLEDS